ncbi:MULTISPECIES: 4'-phosphopantetheinyl transferase family protein [unclassified Marinovum]
MAHSPDKSIFAGQSLLAPPDVRSLSDTRCLLIARYDIAGYQDAAFAQFGQDFPAFLSNAVPKRRAEYLAGRVLAAQAMSCLGVDPVPVGRGSKGEPLWPAGLQGSISHSHGTVGVWLGKGGADLGLDIEALVDSRAARAIRQTVLTPGDLAVLGSEPDAKTCTAAFSAKEALYKALYPRVGRYFGFDHADVVEIRAGGLTLKLTKSLRPAHRAGRVFDIQQDWHSDTVISFCQVDTHARSAPNRPASL